MHISSGFAETPPQLIQRPIQHKEKRKLKCKVPVLLMSILYLDLLMVATSNDRGSIVCLMNQRGFISDAQCGMAS